MVTPIAVRIASHELHAVGRTAGRLFALSTAGSIAGTFATAFWLIPELGVDQLIAVGAATLLLAALPLALTDGAWILAAAGAGLAAVAVAGALSLGADRGDAVAASSLRNYSPLYRTRQDRCGTRPRRFSPASSCANAATRVTTTSSSSSRPAFATCASTTRSRARCGSRARIDAYFPYTSAFAVALGYRPSTRDLLFIGLGGGSSLKRIHRDFPQVRMRAVEIDPEVVDVARKWFAFPSSIPVTVDDGRRYLERHDRRYDVIAVDAYYADAIPFHLTTREFLETVRARLKPGGVVVANVIGAVRGDGSKLLRSFVRTYREVFPTVVLHPVSRRATDAFATANVILVASTGAAPEREALAARWNALRRAHPTAPDLRRVIARRVDDVPTNDVPTLTDDYAPTDALLDGVTGSTAGNSVRPRCTSRSTSAFSIRSAATGRNGRSSPATRLHASRRTVRTTSSRAAAPPSPPRADFASFHGSVEETKRFASTTTSHNAVVAVR